MSFRFTIGPVNPTYGHFIESINNVSSNDPFDWILFENATKMSSQVGKLDLSLYIAIGSHSIDTRCPLVDYVT